MSEQYLTKACLLIKAIMHVFKHACRTCFVWSNIQNKLYYCCLKAPVHFGKIHLLKLRRKRKREDRALHTWSTNHYKHYSPAYPEKKLWVTTVDCPNVIYQSNSLNPVCFLGTANAGLFLLEGTNEQWNDSFY